MGLDRPVHADWAARLFGSRPAATLALLRAAWDQAVGAELAQRTDVLALEGITLRIRVPDARWRKALHRMQPQILARLRAVAGNLAPGRLGFQERQLGAPEEVPGSVARPEAAPPAPAEGTAPAAVRSGAEAIEDPELRARFLATAARYLARSR